jgi:hypothetical protein
MTANNFRLLLIASLVLTVAGLVCSLVPLPEDFSLAEQSHVDNISIWRWALDVLILMVALVVSAFAYYGLFCLRAWAPRLALWATALTFLTYLPILDYCVAQFAFTLLLEFLGTCIWGVILAVSLSPAYKTQFQTMIPVKP